jgi:hypothetical protein
MTDRLSVEQGAYIVSKDVILQGKDGFLFQLNGLCHLLLLSLEALYLLVLSFIVLTSVGLLIMLGIFTLRA